jgi:hypothetical protein
MFRQGLVLAPANLSRGLNAHAGSWRQLGAEPTRRLRALRRNSSLKGQDPVKTLYAGAVVALAAGLLAGAAMKPDLDGDEQPAGAQTLADPAPRASGAFDDEVTYASYPAYHGATPDYVLGTDWKKLTTPGAAPRTAPSRDRDEIVRLEEILRSPAPDDDPPAAGEAPQAPAGNTPAAWNSDSDDPAAPAAGVHSAR